jgi:hypothetical protein
MNNKIKAAVAGAVLASASVANAGITWDAGEWTVDMNGNVNAFAVFSSSDNSTGPVGGLAATQSCWLTLIKIACLSLQVFYHHG